MTVVPASALNVEAAAAALLFAAIFIFGGRIHPLRRLFPDRRTVISFSAGMSAAYVFVRLMPELHLARSAFVESAAPSVSLAYQGMGIYFLALVGFLMSYGLEHWRARLEQAGGADAAGSTGFKLHVGGFAAYVGLMGYLLVRNIEETTASIALYAVAMAFHFLAVDHALREEHGAVYQRIGRWVLAAMALLGWGAGLLFAVPTTVSTMLLAFISGAVIVNSSIMELPTEKDGRFVPFLMGGLLYGGILSPLA